MLEEKIINDIFLNTIQIWFRDSEANNKQVNYQINQIKEILAF